jgi:ABC-type glucose/galactose transport system permease subunit
MRKEQSIFVVLFCLLSWHAAPPTLSRLKALAAVLISSSGEVIGILTLAGSGKFRGTSFGISFEEARVFLTAEGVIGSSPRSAEEAPHASSTD